MAIRPPLYALFLLLFLSSVMKTLTSSPPCHAVIATLDHLMEVFKYSDKPQEEVYRFYEDWLVVNNQDYRDSPFYSWVSAKGLFRQ